MTTIKKFLPHALALAFAVACAAAFRSDISQLSLRAVGHAWDALVIAGALSLLNYFLRSLRWRAYLARLGYSYSLGFSIASFISGFAFTLSPGKLGEMVRARYYTPLGVPLSAVAGAFLIERLMDLLAMIALAGLAIISLGRFQVLFWSAAMLVAAVLLFLTAWPHVCDGLRKRWQLALPARITQVLDNLANMLTHASALLDPAALGLGFMLALLAWGAEGVGLWVLTSVFPSPHPDLFAAVGTYAIAVLLGGLSFLPGGLGTTEAAMAALLATTGLSLADAMLATLLCRLLTLWLAVLLGWIAVFSLRQDPEAVTRWR